jgi:hypothetical protein
MRAYSTIPCPFCSDSAFTREWCRDSRTRIYRPDNQITSFHNRIISIVAQEIDLCVGINKSLHHERIYFSATH